MKFVHAADLHLDSALSGLSRYDSAPADEIRGATRRALINLVDLCLEERAGLLAIAGDLFDGDWRDVSTGLFFVAQMSRLVEAGTRVVWVRGNHDAVSQIRRSIRCPERVLEFAADRAQTFSFEELDLAVHGRSFPKRDVTEDLAAGYPAPIRGVLNVGLLHTALEGRAGHDRYAPCRAVDLVARGYEYWALGHVHQREIVHSEPWLVFPGNLQGRHAKELGEKGAMLIEYERDQIHSVEHRALDVVRWTEVVLGAASFQHRDDLLSEAQHRLRRAAEDAQGRLLVFRVRVVGATALDAALRAGREQLVEELCALSFSAGGSSAWLERLMLETAPPEQSPVLGDDALLEIERVLSELGTGDGGALSEVLGDLARKLPGEVAALVPALDARDAAAQRELLEDVRSLLWQRLSQQSSGGA
jgi:hypothetical protein